MQRPEWPVDLEHRADRRQAISHVVLPNGTAAATADPRLAMVFAQEALAMWERRAA